MISHLREALAHNSSSNEADFTCLPGLRLSGKKIKIKIKNQQVNLILRLASVRLDIDDSGCGSVLAQGYLPVQGGYNEN